MPRLGHNACVCLLTVKHSTAGWYPGLMGLGVTPSTPSHGLAQAGPSAPLSAFVIFLQVTPTPPFKPAAAACPPQIPRQLIPAVPYSSFHPSRLPAQPALPSQPPTQDLITHAGLFQASAAPGPPQISSRIHCSKSVLHDSVVTSLLFSTYVIL